MEEKLCYELECEDDTGGTVLVYVNAMTGAEEEILLVLLTDGGVLTV